MTPADSLDPSAVERSGQEIAGGLRAVADALRDLATIWRDSLREPEKPADSTTAPPLPAQALPAQAATGDPQSWLPPDWLGPPFAPHAPPAKRPTFSDKQTWSELEEIFNDREPPPAPTPPLPQKPDIDSYVPPVSQDPTTPFNEFRKQLHGPLPPPVDYDWDAVEPIRVEKPPRLKIFRPADEPRPPDFDQPAGYGSNVRDAPPHMTQSLGVDEPQQSVLSAMNGFAEQARLQSRLTVSVLHGIMRDLQRDNSRLEALEDCFLRSRGGGRF